MDELPAELRALLLNHPSLTLTDSNKIRCSLSGHEFPCVPSELQKYIQGKKYKKLSASAEFNFGQYEPHIVDSTKQPNRLFCKLTLRHINKQPLHVTRHVNGRRFKKALTKYEECVKQGVEYVPARLKQKRPQSHTEDGGPRKQPKQGNAMWAPSSSDEDESDSDSMSDLYPPSMFGLKNPAGEEEDDEEDDFQTDEDEEMEVEQQTAQKRKKAQAGGFHKKFRNNRWKSGRKKQGKMQNGK